jgi:flagellar assembly factor FliW
MERQTIEVMTRLGAHSIDLGKILVFPRGLIGFEEKRQFTLLQIAPDSPFLMLQSMEDPTLGLLVADPYAFLPDYRIRVSTAEQTMLHIDSQEQVAVLVTAGIPHGKPELTALNLTGPILINHARRIGLQVPQAESDFPPRWRIHRDAEAKADGQGGADPSSQ